VLASAGGVSGDMEAVGAFDGAALYAVGAAGNIFKATAPESLIAGSCERK